MSKYSNTVEYNIRTTLDSSGIAKLQAELAQLQNKVNTLGTQGLIPKSATEKTLADIKKIQIALQQAFNPKLGMLNTSKFMSSLKAQGASLNSIYQSFNNAGAAGQRAFNSMYGQIAKIDTGMRSVSKTTDKIFNTMGNTFRWGLIASGFAAIMNSAHQAAEYVSDLDKSLTEIQMVSAASRDNMNELARAANEAAKELGGTTVQMTEATKVFIQQGLSQEEALKMGEYAVHLANVSEQDSTITSDELTAMKNAFQIPIEDLGNAVSKWAVIANNAAVSMEELSVASQKAASVAQTTGVDMEQFAGHIAAIEATTREAPENIGNGLKTLYSRFADIKLGETLEDGVNLGQFSSALKKVGVDVLDASGEMKDVGSILEETMAVWKTLDKTQQNALATTVAGRFQLARFEALMNSQDIYKQAVSVARAETGTETYDRMQETYRESLQGRTQALIASVEELFLDIFNSNSFNGAVDALQGLVDVLDEVIKATGGGETALLGIVTVLTSLASNSLSRGVANFITNRQAERAGSKNLLEQQAQARDQLIGKGLNTGEARTDAFARDVARINQYAPMMNEEQQRREQELITNRIQNENALSQAQERRTQIETQLRIAAKAAGVEMERDTAALMENIAAAEQNGTVIDFTSKEYEDWNNLLKTTIQSLSSLGEKMREDPSKVSVVNIKKLRDALRELVEQEIFVGEQNDKMRGGLALFDQFAKGNITVEQLGRGLKDLTGTCADLSVMLGEKVPRDSAEAVAGMQNLETTIIQADTAIRHTSSEMQGFSKVLNMQETTNKLVGLATGIGQLAFAWQNFQHAGDILEDDSLSNSEKLIQIIINLSFMLPMLKMGLAEVKDGFSALGNVFSTLLNGMEGYGAKLALATASEEAAMAATKANTAARLENTAANIMNSTSIDENTKRSALLIVAKEAGIVAAEDLSNAEIMESLSHDANTAAVEAETKALEKQQLVKKQAKQKKAAENFAKVKDGLLSIGSTGTSFLGLGSAAAGAAVFAGAIAAMAVAIGGIALAYHTAQERYKEYREDLLESIAASDERISSIQQEKKNFEELYNTYETTGQGSNQLKDAAEKLNDTLGTQGMKLASARGDWAAYIEELKKAEKQELETNARMKMDDARDRTKNKAPTTELSNGALAFAGLSGDTVEFAGSEGGGSINYQDGESYLETIYKVQDAYSKATQKVNELTKERNAAIAEGDREAVGILDKQIEEWKHYEQEYKNIVNTEDAQEVIKDIEAAANDTFQVQLMDKAFNGANSIDEIKQRLLDGNEAFKQAYEAMGEEDAQTFFESFLSAIADQTDSNYLKNLISQYFKEAIQEINLKEVFDSQHYSAREAQEKLEIDENQFSALREEYRQIAELNSDGPYNDQGLQEWKNNIDSTLFSLRNQRKELEKNVKSLEDSGKEIDENGKTLDEWKADLKKVDSSIRTQEKELGNYEDTLDDLAAKYMESAEGLNTLSENIDKWKESFESGSPKEQAEAFGSITAALGQLMNTDASAFDMNFVKNNLDLITDAANGSSEALSQLRENGSKQILVNARLADDVGNIPLYLQDVLDEAQSICNNEAIEAGATLDPSGFIAGLQVMEAQAGATVDNIKAYLESLEASGVEAYLEDGPIMNMVDNVSTIASGLFSKIGANSIAESFQNASLAVAVKLNKVKFRKIGNGGSGFTGRNAGGGSGGGGGGGGGGKSYEPKHKDPIEEEIDRYEKVQTALDEVDSQINKLTVDQDRLMGNNWIENLEKETGLLQEQIPLYEEKLRIQKEEQQELQKQLADNYGARFNDIGLLQNYAEIHKRLEKEVNDLINRYNSTTTEEGQNALEKQIESAQERLEKFKKQYQRYDTLVSKDMIDTQKALEEIQNRLEDIRYEAYKARKEAAEQLKDLRDDRREFNESIATLFNDDASLSLGNAMSRFKDLFQADEKYVANAITMYKKKLSQATSEDMKKFYQAQIDSLKKAQANGTSVLDLNFQRLNEVMAEYDKWLAGGQTSWSEADLWEAMQDAFDDAVDLAKELKDQVDNIHDKIADVIDEMDEATERRKDAFESINDELEYMRDMSELLYGDQAYATQTQTYNLQAHNNEQLLKTLEAAQKANQKILEATKDNAAAQEEYQAALEKEKELQGEIFDTRKEIAEAYKDAKEAANNLAVQNWLDQFQGEIDGVKVPLKYAQEAWERINENADLYLDELNRAWETEKLQNKYLELINNNTDPTIQKQITDQMNQQLGYLRDKTNLSKYDVEYANAQLEILQKTIALEDARANKNQMRLRRDTQGNYSYVYAASQADIASAENDLLDAQMNGYNISVEANRNSADSFYQKIQAMADQLRDAANDADLSEKQIAAITADIIKDGYEYLDAMGEQLTTAQKNMIESFIQAAQNLGAENSQAVQIIADELINNVDATVETISDKFVSGVERMIGPDGLALFREEAEQTRDDIIKNVHDFKVAISDLNVNIETPLNDIDTNLNHVTTSMGELADEAQRFYDIMNNNTGVILQAAGELAEYQARLTDAENELSVYSEKVNKLSQDLETQKTINTQLNATNSDLQRQLEQAKNGGGSGGSGGGPGSGGGSGGSLTRNRVGEIFYLIHYGQVGNEGDRTPNLRARGYSDREIRAGQKAINIAYGSDTSNEDAISWAAAHMKTGGYTGTWSGANIDSNGKLAVLHQKELVLNAADTENILSAVDIIRNIVAALKGNISGGLLTNMISSIGQTGGDTIEQRVEIKAEFPNATSAREIEEAFDTIANTSYQYAYNKNTKVI